MCWRRCFAAALSKGSLECGCGDGSDERATNAGKTPVKDKLLTLFTPPPKRRGAFDIPGVERKEGERAGATAVSAHPHHRTV
mmetsp:Transcript_1164/g.3047  ORF Transcript_1164/g.3047 Transcript_1164/m.3047 type:complete len:82 (+) Transcript_1164:15-260(+)